MLNLKKPVFKKQMLLLIKDAQFIKQVSFHYSFIFVACLMTPSVTEAILYQVTG
jgi:hypothetical protein